tara:strand:- start:1619 stop:1855 length:237 start_codon:yes stop_codon:yes gene_type:complete
VKSLKIGIKTPKIKIEKPNKKFLLSINVTTKEKTENSDLKSQNSLIIAKGRKSPIPRATASTIERINKGNTQQNPFID